MAKNRPTINDIARELNITASTVSRALNGHPSISERTSRAVLEAARKMQYQPNHIAAALRRGRSNIIGVIVPAADRSFFATVIRGIEDEVAAVGYNVMVCQTYENLQKEERILETLLRTQVDGIIASIAKQATTYDHYRRVAEEGIPVVLFDNTGDSLGVSTVTINDFQGAYLATQHLIGQGCRRIAHFAGQQHLMIYQERLRGYRQAMDDHGLPVKESLIVHCPSDINMGRERARQLAAASPLPDAVFSSSDYAALGAMQQFKSAGIRIPADIAIVGFANEPFTSYVDPALSTVDQHSHRIGQNAARIFLQEIEGKAGEDGYIPQRSVLEPELIVRASSQRKNL